MGNRKLNKGSKVLRPNLIKKFTHESENDKIDITPLFVFMAGLLYNKDNPSSSKEEYQIVRLQRKLMRETIGKHILNLIEKDERKYCWQVEPENLLFADDKIMQLYENSCTTLFKKPI